MCCGECSRRSEGDSAFPPSPRPAAALGESLTALLHIVLARTRLRQLSLSGQLRGAARVSPEGHPCGRPGSSSARPRSGLRSPSAIISALASDSGCSSARRSASASTSRSSRFGAASLTTAAISAASGRSVFSVSFIGRSPFRTSTQPAARGPVPRCLSNRGNRRYRSHNDPGFGQRGSAAPPAHGAVLTCRPPNRQQARPRSAPCSCAQRKCLSVVSGGTRHSTLTDTDTMRRRRSAAILLSVLVALITRPIYENGPERAVRPYPPPRTPPPGPGEGAKAALPSLAPSRGDSGAEQASFGWPGKGRRSAGSGSRFAVPMRLLDTACASMVKR